MRSDLKDSPKIWRANKRNLNKDLLSPKYKQKVENTKKQRLRTLEDEESEKLIREYMNGETEI